MRYLLVLVTSTFFGLAAYAVPPAGALSYEDGLKQSASYNEVVQKLQSTAQNIQQVEDINLLIQQQGQEKLRGCGAALLSRSGVLMLVVFTTSEGSQSIVFGTTEIPTQFKACAIL